MIVRLPSFIQLMIVLTKTTMSMSMSMSIPRTRTFLSTSMPAYVARNSLSREDCHNGNGRNINTRFGMRHLLLSSSSNNNINNNIKKRAITTTALGMLSPSQSLSSSSFISNSRMEQHHKFHTANYAQSSLTSLSAKTKNSYSYSTSNKKSTQNIKTQKSNKTTSNNNNNKNNKRKSSSSSSDTGGLRRLPVVKAPIELINKATKTIRRECRADPTIKNARNRARKHATITLDTLTKELCIPLRDVVKGYKYEISKLHSFEKVVADLTVKARQKKDGVSLLHLLDDIHECRKEVLACGKDWVAKAKYAETAKEAMDAMVQGEKALVELFDAIVSDPLLLLIDLQKSLRTTPAVRLDTPAVVLVGAPNVGKSSIVRTISSATPEVNNYPFTTRGMTLGHVQVFWKDQTTTAAAIIPELDEGRKGSKIQNNALDGMAGSGINGSYAFTQLCQIMDSPGLLVRDSDDKRNEMESLTLAAMQHLPTAVMYVLDLSGGAGDKCSSVEDQLQLRREVRARFPRRPWIDVVAKYDLGLVEGARETLEDILDGAPYIELSIKEGTGVDELRDEVMRMLGEVRVVLDAMAAVDARSARPSS